MARAVIWPALLLGMSSAVHAQFTTVIDVPPQAAPSSIGSDTQLNLGPGGILGNNFAAGAADGSSTGVEVNILGGTAGYRLTAYAGSVVNITGGSISPELTVNDGAVGNVYGGTIGAQPTVNNGGTLNVFGGDISVGMTANPGGTLNVHGGPIRVFFTAKTGSNVNLYGGEFRLDGQLLSGLNTPGSSVNQPMSSSSVLSGTLADGRPFVIASQGEDRVSDATITLHAAALPAIGPAVIRTSTDPVPFGIREGQKLIIDSYVGDVRGFVAAHGSSIEVEGGTFQLGLEADHVDVLLSSGALRSSNYFYNGSRFEMTGGRLDSARFIDSYAEIRDGLITGAVYALKGSTVDISGGTFDYNLIVGPESTINFSGGEVLGEVSVQQGTLNISGGLIGRFGFLAGTVNMTAGTVGSADDEAFMPTGVFNLSGGMAGHNLTLINDAKLRMTGGSIGNGLSMGSTSSLLMFDGSVGDNASFRGASRSGLYGGDVGKQLTIDEGATVTMSGGSIGDHALLKRGRLNISGGTVGDAFHTGTSSDALLFLYGSEFLLDGQPILGPLNVPLRIDVRNKTLSGILADGTPFSFDLNSASSADEDYFSPSAGVFVQTVSGLRGDYNADDTVDAADYVMWRKMLGQRVQNGWLADGDFSGIVDELDFLIWRENLGRSAGGEGAGVPEPASLLIAAVALCLVGCVSRPCGRSPAMQATAAR